MPSAPTLISDKVSAQLRSVLPIPIPAAAAKGKNNFRDFTVTLEAGAFHARVVATLLIFVISLLAASFPTLSSRISFFRIPRIVFFIGKHFGTGVILSTAFVHLLQDSFDALRSPEVQDRWNVGGHVGLIVLSSLLAIFLVEYVSTSYVDHLHSCSSPSTAAPPTPQDEFPPDLERTPPLPKFTNTAHSNSERTSLLVTTDFVHTPHDVHQHPNPSYGAVHHHGHVHDPVGANASAFFEGHHRHEQRELHLSHHERSRPATMYGPVELARDPQGGVGYHHHEFQAVEGITDISEPRHFHQDYRIDTHEDKVDKKRQIVGILVLQLGIMIHSLVIGLTLSITSGPDFATLLVAVIFHQLFEGLSLGIRIASLPSSQEQEFEYLSVLKPVLACLFAITTPAGILLGILVFEHNNDMAQMRLTQGIMSAISAGMLTYAACVEMLAGDFVMDPILWRSGVGKQALALFSLAAGVTAMALVGS